MDEEPPGARPPHRQHAKGSGIAQALGPGARAEVLVRQYQLRSLPLLVASLVALFLILSGGAVYGYRQRFVGPTTMDGGFNIAVADFGQFDGAGVSPSDAGRTLSKNLYKNLADEFATLPKPFNALVWHDSLHPPRMKAHLGHVTGASPQEWDEAAGRIAGRVKADMVIYGVLDQAQDPATFVPSFYLRGTKGETDDVRGDHRLGKPIKLSGRSGDIGFSADLLARNTIMIRFVTALTWEINERKEDALATLQEIATDVERPIGDKKRLDWKRSEGQEILYFFIGREQQLIGEDRLKDGQPEQAKDWFDKAEQSFTKALSINRNYARPHVGLGNNAVFRADLLPTPERAQSPALTTAIAEYTAARDGAQEPTDKPVAIKAELGLAVSHYKQAESLMSQGDMDAADRSFGAAAGHASSALALAGEEYQRHRGMAASNLGAAYRLKAYLRQIASRPDEERPLLQQAIDAYGQCLAAAKAQPEDPTLADSARNTCAPWRNDAEARLRNLQ